MIKEQIKVQTVETISPVISDYGAEIVDVEIKGPPTRRILVVYVDREGGISIDDCVNLSKRILTLEKLERLLGAGYRLEVSSPGVDRPLKSFRDFQRNLGKEIRIDYRNELGTHRVEGEIDEASMEYVIIRSLENVYKIRYENIITAKQKLKW